MPFWLPSKEIEEWLCKVICQERRAIRSRPDVAASRHHACEPKSVHPPTVDAQRRNERRWSLPLDRLAIAKINYVRIPLSPHFPHSDRSAREIDKPRNPLDRLQ